MDLLEQLAADRDIRNLVALYPVRCDDLDAEAWAALFADDGALVLGNRRIQGRDNLVPWLNKVQARARYRHMMLNAAITIDSPTTAHGSLDMVLLRLEGEKWVIDGAPRYTDKYVKTADGWKFLERVLDAKTG
jgi:hypothetical protein